MTKNRSETLKKSLRNLTKDEIILEENFKLSISEINTIQKGSSYHLNIPIIYKLSDNIMLMQKKLQTINREKYLSQINKFYQNYSQLMKKLVCYIGIVDLNSTIAKLSSENIYSKPIIIESKCSLFKAKDIRHPIVEKIQTNYEYVPNDITLSEDGMLLYGTNACGKSTLMKSVGLTIIMAQAGFYVPCSELQYLQDNHHLRLK